MTDTTLLQTITKDSPELLEAADINKNSRWWKDAIQNDCPPAYRWAAALIRYAIVMELWEADTDPQMKRTGDQWYVELNNGLAYFGHTPLAALYAAWLAKAKHD